MCWVEDALRLDWGCQSRLGCELLRGEYGGERDKLSRTKFLCYVNAWVVSRVHIGLLG